MKALKVLWIIILIACVYSCNKKKYPEPIIIENASVYYSRLTIDNTPFELKAGVNGYYMYSSYQLDSNSLYGFVGELKKRDCSNCNNSLKIQINDYKLTTSNSAFDIDSSISIRRYPILAGIPAPKYYMQFITPNTNVASYNWKFGDGTESNSQNPIKEYSEHGKYTVCLTTTASTTGYVSSVCNKENVGSDPFSVTIAASGFSGNSITFYSDISGGKTPNQYRYLWNFGDGSSSEQNSSIVNYAYRGSYAVTLRVIDNYGDTAYAAYNAKTQTDQSSSVTNYTVSNAYKITPPAPLSKIIITWTDENGVVYTSNDISQPSSSSFEITSVSNNENNELLQPTKKITAKFNCKLYNGTKSITINNAEVVICVAYKP
jgi:PKD repeat protein